MRESSTESFDGTRDRLSCYHQTFHAPPPTQHTTTKYSVVLRRKLQKYEYNVYTTSDTGEVQMRSRHKTFGKLTILGFVPFLAAGSIRASLFLRFVARNTKREK